MDLKLYFGDFHTGRCFYWGDSVWYSLLYREGWSGIIVNKWLQLGVWDYSGLPFQIFGQISLQFAVIFSGLCAVGILLGGYLLYWIYGEEKPHYHFL